MTNDEAIKIISNYDRLPCEVKEGTFCTLQEAINKVNEMEGESV